MREQRFDLCAEDAERQMKELAKALGLKKVEHIKDGHLNNSVEFTFRSGKVMTLELDDPRILVEIPDKDQ